MTRQRILVTGGAGFIGSQTVDLLLTQQKHVLVLDNLSSGKRENLPLAHPRLEFIEGDVLDYPLLVASLSNCDAVLHLAAISSVQQSIENPITSFQVNTQGFLHVLEAIRQSKKATRLVYASSAAVYGNVTKLPCCDEAALVNLPLSPYALQKIHNEHYANLYTRLYAVKSLALRYFNVYGPRQDPHSPYSGVISRFFDAYKNNQPLSIFGDGEQSRDFIYITDVAKANALALESDCSGVLNIATGKPETLLQLLQYIENINKKPLQTRMEPARLGDIKASYAATKKAFAELGFKSSVSLEEGMRLMSENT